MEWEAIEAEGVASRAPGGGRRRGPPRGRLALHIGALLAALSVPARSKAEPQAPPASALSQQEIRALPGAFGDAFRALGSLAGVTPLVSGLPYFSVRGAPPGTQGYYYDGVALPQLFHLGVGPAVIQPWFVDGVTLYPASYPARMGRAVGGVVQARPRPVGEAWHREARVRAVDAGAMVSLPVGAGALEVGARYSYPSLLLPLVSPELDAAYWDYQARWQGEPGRAGQFSVLALGSQDSFNDARPDSDYERATMAFHRVDLRHDSRIGEADLRWAVTLGYDASSLSGVDRGTFRNESVGTRLELSVPLGSGATLAAGADAQRDDYRVEMHLSDDASDVERSFTTRRDLAIGLWTELELRPTRRLVVAPGLRLDVFGSGPQARLSADPRIAATFEITPELRLLHAIAVAHQAPSFFAPLPAVRPTGLHRGLQRTVQTSAGAELDGPYGLSSSLVLFQNAFYRVTDPAGLLSFTNDPDIDARSDGRAIGAELTLRKALLERVGGQLSYTLSRTTRSYRNHEGPAAFDRTHVLQLAGFYDLGRGWTAGHRFVAYSGVPAMPRESDFDVAEPLGLYPFRRTYPFWRVDLRLEKRWRVSREASWALSFEMLNATLNREVVERRCSVFECRETPLGPVSIPSVALQYED